MKPFLVACQAALLALLMTACSEEAQPYEEVNTTLTSSQEQGHIQTH